MMMVQSNSNLEAFCATEIFSNLKAQNLDRKEFATKVINYRHPNILFSMLDGKSYKDSIYKIIKRCEYSKFHFNQKYNQKNN